MTLTIRATEQMCLPQWQPCKTYQLLNYDTVSVTRKKNKCSGEEKT